LAVLEQVIQSSTATTTDKETWKSACILAASIQEGASSTSGGAAVPSRRRSFVSGLIPQRKASTTTAQQIGAQHVMISYQWTHQDPAKAIETYLSEAGVKTWFDLKDMSIYDVIDL